MDAVTSTTTTTITTAVSTTTTTVPQSAVLTGAFTDSPVQGMEYATPTLSGTTDADGKFSYRDGETVAFSMGGVALGSTTGKSTVTLYSLAPNATSNTDQKVMNIAKLLQSLDSGGDLNTRIVISPTAKAAMTSAGSIDFDQTTAAFAADPKVSQVLTATGKTLLSDSAVSSHITSQIAALSVRDTTFGKVAGKLAIETAAYTWLGIPYAAAPTGTNRWKAPSDPTPWPTTLSATSLGKACPQNANVGVIGVGVTQSEDCLNLNIWAPASGETNLPVIVYVHGGSNVTGYGASYIQWGGTMASEQKVVFVSINYRLNLFGWLNHPALKTGDALSDSGNFGTLDIVQALKFVKNNIASFGGDPNNVTLAGESAGAANVWTLLVSPQASGLFHKAMAMSGGLSTSKTTALGQSYANTVLQQLVIRDGLATDTTSAATYLASRTNAQIKDYLYSQSTSALLTVFQNAAISNGFVDRFMDGTVLPPDSATAFTGSYLNNVPLISGNTNDEGKIWGYFYATSAAAWNSMFSDTPVSIDQIVKPANLPVSKAFTNCSDAGYNAVTLNAGFVFGNISTYCAAGFFNTNFFWWFNTISMNRYQSLQPKVYAYNFAWNQQTEPMKTVLGAAHATDIGFMFGNISKTVAGEKTGGFTYGFGNDSTAGREALSGKMRKSLSAFMRTGDPNNDSLGTTWLPWSTSGGGANRLIFDADANNANITMSTGNAPLAR